MNPFSAPIFIPSTLQSPFSRHPCQLVCSFLNNFSNIKTSKFSFCLSQEVETVAHMWSMHFIFFSLYLYIYKENKYYIYIYIYILLIYSCLTKFQGHSKVIQLYIYTYIIFQFIFHYRYFKRLTKGLQFPVLYSKTLLVFAHFFLIRNPAFYSY